MAQLVRTVVLGIGMASIAADLATSSAQAQPAAALGKPLPAPDLPVGTVSVRIVAGSPSSPVVGTDVTLVVNGTPRVARTDAAGRAQFAGLPAGATAIASVVDADKAPHASEQLTLPDSGGVRVMITTKPWQAGAAGAAPFAGGGAGMPNPRQLSGEGRAERSDPPGTLTIRVSYDDFKDTPADVPVALVGYGSDDTVMYRSANTDKDGRVQFGDLDRSGGTSYFAMTQLPRNGAVDRIVSTPVLLESQVGVRMVLSSEKRDSTSPPIDDLGKADPQVATPAGKVRVALEGIPDRETTVALVDVATKQVIGTVKAEAGAPDPSRVQGGAQFTADAKLPPGTMDVQVVGGAGQSDAPIPGIEIRVIPASSTDPTGGFSSITGADGTVRMALQVTGPQKAVFTINGRALASQPFDLAKSGGKLQIRARWEDSGRLAAMFDVAPSPSSPGGRVVYAEATSRGQHYRSMPFQLLGATGTSISVYVYPRTMFRFQLQASAEDQLLAAQGRFEVMNSSWTPYRAGPDGLLVPTPKGAKGAVVFGSDQAEVSVVAGEGFRVMRPIPPGGRQFHAGFSLPVEDGKVVWSLDLPLGAYQSEIDLRKTPEMTAKTPPGFPVETKTVPQGTFIVMGPIGILPRQSMEMTIEGMPSLPAWRKWVPRIVGLLVVGLLVAGVFLALYRGPRKAGKPGHVPGAGARRQRLLDELVELERGDGDPRRREQVLSELEQLWG
jgi:hypothetical protein